MKEDGNTILFIPKEFSLDNLMDMFKEVQKFEVKRRERLDKEYTLIEKITKAEINTAIKDAGEYANRAMVKVKFAGSYMEVSIIWLKAFFEAAEKEMENYERTSN